jgi:hypothetical protein
MFPDLFAIYRPVTGIVVVQYLEMMEDIFIVIARVPLMPINQSASARHLAAFASIL